jgi:probable HAF family extracellular repeat protein
MVLALAAPSIAHAAPEFTGLGTLPGGISSRAFGISADGSTVVGSADAADHHIHAFRWTAATGMQDLGMLQDGHFAEAIAVSANGSVVVGFGDTADAHVHAFRWTSNEGFRDLGVIPGTTSSQASGISGDGNVIVGVSFVGAVSIGFRWTQATGMTSVGPLDGTYLFNANGANADGSAIVGVSSEGASLSDSTGIHGLGILPGGTQGATALAISPDGTIVVGASDSDQGVRAFRWTAQGGMNSLGILPGANESVARCASGDGSTIGGEVFFSPDPVHGFVWRSGTMVDVNDLLVSNGADLLGFSIDSVRGISADGLLMTGSAVNGNVAQAWIAGIPPICASADFNCDGDSGTDADIESFFACLAGSCPSACGRTADINADGDSGTDQDIESFFRILAGGNC